MWAIRIVSLVSLVILGMASSRVLACDISSAQTLPSVTIEVGMMNAIWHRGNYRAAAYDELGDVLQGSHSEVTGSVYFQFTYTVSFLGFSGTHTLGLCIDRAVDKTWQEAVDAMFENLQANTPLFLDDDEPPAGFGDNYSDHLLQQAFTAMQFPEGAVIVINGNGSGRGIVTCQPACF